MHLPVEQAECYSQTFENRSSAPASPPPAGLIVLSVAVVLLVHPPNSSSADTFGTKPPDAPGTIGLLARDAQSFDAVLITAGFDGSGAGLGGSAQALPPQTSDPPQPLLLRGSRGLDVAVVDVAGGVDFG